MIVFLSWVDYVSFNISCLWYDGQSSDGYILPVCSWKVVGKYCDDDGLSVKATYVAVS